MADMLHKLNLRSQRIRHPRRILGTEKANLGIKPELGPVINPTVLLAVGQLQTLDLLSPVGPSRDESAAFALSTERLILILESNFPALWMKLI